MKKWLLFSIIIYYSFFTNDCLAQAKTTPGVQGETIDSLLAFLKTDKPDTNKVLHLYKLGVEYRLIGEYTKGLKYSNIGLDLSRKINYKRGIASSYRNLGNIYLYQGNYTDALKSYFPALKMYEEISDKIGIASTYNGIGIIYDYQGNYPEALKNYFSSLKIYEVIGDKAGMASSYNNIGLIYDYQGDYINALKNYLASLKIEEETGDKSGISDSYTNLGNFYGNQGNYSAALKNYFAALKIKEQLGDKKGIAEIYINIATTEIKLGNTASAKKYAEKSLALSKEIGSKEDIKDSYKYLANADRILGDYKAAYTDYEMFIIYRDSLDNEETRKSTIQQSMTYNFEKQQLADSIRATGNLKQEQIKHNQQIQQQKIFTYGGLIGFTLMLVIAGLSFKAYRTKQKANLIIVLQKQRVDKAYSELDTKNTIIEEKHREITDSINYAERIQRSFLATKEQLDENLKDYFVFFKPKDVVSGDFYWATIIDDSKLKIQDSRQIENDNIEIAPTKNIINNENLKSNISNLKFILVTADSTGHGVPGAIMSLLNVTSLEKAVESYIRPADILNSTRKTIIERLKKDGSEHGGKDGMDASIVLYDFENKKLTIAAANNPVWIVRASTLREPQDSASEGTQTTQIIEIKPDKMPVGKHDRDTISFTQQEVDLQSGDVVYTLTDGYTDQFGGPNGKKFMSKKLREMLISIAHLPMHEQKQLLEKTFVDWVGSMEQVDDVTLIGVRV